MSNSNSNKDQNVESTQVSTQASKAKSRASKKRHALSMKVEGINIVMSCTPSGFLSSFHRENLYKAQKRLQH